MEIVRYLPLPAARRVTKTLDSTLAEIRSETLSGRLRIGLPEDHGRTALAGIVADFAAAHPRVELEVHCALGTGFGPALAGGVIDLAIHEVAAPPPDAEVLRADTLVWMAARGHDAAMRDPLARFPLWHSLGCPVPSLSHVKNDRLRTP